jgi:hypothetical protein
MSSAFPCLSFLLFFWFSYLLLDIRMENN